MATPMTTVELTAPQRWGDSLRRLLSDFPAIRLEASGWMVSRFRISGPPQDMAALAPRLQEWEHDQVSRDAW